VQDFHDVSSLTITIGDDGSWKTISTIVHPGRMVKLSLNGRLQFTGRFEENEVPVDPGSGAVAQIVARTKMATRATRARTRRRSFRTSASSSSCSRCTSRSGTRRPTSSSTPRPTGTCSPARSRRAALVDLDPLQEGRAKVKPPETIFDAASRHLKRYHMAHWDAADGRIVVGKPDDAQAPILPLLGKRGVDGAGEQRARA
jgi:hypothetical protein